jgi:cobalt/nickel transport system permease protein
MSEKLPAFLLKNEERISPSQKGGRHRLSFVDSTLSKLAELISTGYIQAETFSRKGFLQNLDSRTKLAFLLSFIILTSCLRQISSLCFNLVFILALYPLSGINLFTSLKKVFWPLFFFGFIVVAPALLNIVSGGEIKLKLIQFTHEHTFWIYHIPASIGISIEGTIVVCRLFLKIGSSILLTLLIAGTTSFAEIIKALRMFKIPDIILLSITLSYKFIFILSRTTAETYLALRSRWIKQDNDIQSSKIIAGRIAFVFRKSFIKYEEVYRAMIARGFSGKVDLCYSGKFKKNDLVFVLVFISLGLISVFQKM